VRATGEIGAQLVAEEPRQPHDAPLVVLRRAPGELPVDIAEGLGDLDLAAQQVQPLDLEAGDLPGPESRVGADQHQQPVAGIDCLGELLDLDGVQEVHLELGPAGEAAHVGGDVDGQPLRIDRRVEDHAEHGVRVADPGGARAVLDEAGDPFADGHAVDARLWKVGRIWLSRSCR
jgi:hypothetical protein